MATDHDSGPEPKSADFASVIEYHSDQDQKDHHQLATLGKKGILKRTFHFISILGFSCTVLITWEAATILFAQGLTNGGSMGIIISFVLVWFGNLSVFASLSELVSMAPTSGGQYHWVSMLAPKRASKILSYVTGWLTIGGWLGSMAAGCFLIGTMLQGIINLTHPSYMGTGWQGSLFMFLAALISTFVNSMANSLLPKFEALAFVVHVAGFFAILIPVVYLAPHNNSAFVFQTFSNLGKFPTDGLAFFLGMMGNVVAFVGADAAFHMCEEVQNPSVVVPQSIMAAIIINGAVGLAMMVAMLYCISDIDNTLASPTGYPFMEIFRTATGSRAAAAGMVVVMIIMAMTATIGIHASLSRLVWAFSRDKALPGWKVWSKVNKRTSVPQYAVFLTGMMAALLGLINIGSTAAFNNIASLSVSGLYSSYFAAASLLLYRRCTNGILPADSSTTASQLAWGPWRLPGFLGTVNNAIACVYLVIVWFFSFWPVEWHVDAKNMNYGVLVTGLVTAFSLCYYLIWGKKLYRGPIAEI